MPGTFIATAYIERTGAQVIAAQRNNLDFAYQYSVVPDRWTLLIASIDYIRGDNYAPNEVSFAFMEALQRAGIQDYAYEEVPPVDPYVLTLEPGHDVYLSRPQPYVVDVFLID